MDLKAKVALVTGAAHRLGRAVALELAAHGCDLLIHYHRSESEARQTRQEVEAFGVRAVLVQADLSRSEGIIALFEALDATFSQLDLLVNSAAVLERMELLETSEQDWRSSVGLNLKGAFFCLQQAAVRMQLGGSGAIVNISDTAAYRPWKRYPLHSVSKAGIEMLTQVAAYALAPTIRVNAVLPGPTLKPPWMNDDRWQDLIRKLPLAGQVPPEEVAQAVVFLMRNEYVTGHTMRVDAGSLL